MQIRENFLRNTLILIVFLMLTMSVSCIFSPKSDKKSETPAGQWETPTTPRKVINNLQVSFSQLDIDFFERCLHENYYYLSPSDIDSLDIYWSRSEDVSAVRGVMSASREIIFNPSEINIYEEYGKNVPNKPDGAKLDEMEEHPDDIWYICSYYISIDIFAAEYGDFKVQQDMKFKMVEDLDTHLYSIIRWVDDVQILD